MGESLEDDPRCDPPEILVNDAVQALGKGNQGVKANVIADTWNAHWAFAYLIEGETYSELIKLTAADGSLRL